MYQIEFTLRRQKLLMVYKQGTNMFRSSLNKENKFKPL